MIISLIDVEAGTTYNVVILESTETGDTKLGHIITKLLPACW